MRLKGNMPFGSLFLARRFVPAVFTDTGIAKAHFHGGTAHLKIIKYQRSTSTLYEASRHCGQPIGHRFHAHGYPALER